MADPYGNIGIDPNYAEQATLYEPAKQARVMPKGYGDSSTPVMSRPPVHARIAEMAKELTVAGETVAEARQAFSHAARFRSEAEARFAAVAEALMAAIHEHREGTPENEPYERER